MANFKRKKRKEFTIHYCGHRHCKQDEGKLAGNGRNRYLPTYWKNTFFAPVHPWRYNGYPENEVS